jgi:hypothetical protein
LIPITLVIDSYCKSGMHVYILVLRPVRPAVDLQQQLMKSKVCCGFACRVLYCVLLPHIYIAVPVLLLICNNN